MKKEALAFWELVKKDAAVQEKVLLAAKQPDALFALGQIASGAGLKVTVADLVDSLEGELSDGELEAASGGALGGPTPGALIEARVLAMRSPAEWFAE